MEERGEGGVAGRDQSVMETHFRRESVFSKEFVGANGNVERLKKQRNAISNPISSRKNQDQVIPPQTVRIPVYGIKEHRILT